MAILLTGLGRLALAADDPLWPTLRMDATTKTHAMRFFFDSVAGQGFDACFGSDRELLHGVIESRARCNDVFDGSPNRVSGPAGA